VTRPVAAFVVMLFGVVAALVYLENPETPDFVQRLRYPLEYRQIVRGHARNYDLDPALLAAVIYQESKFDARAKSPSGAIGLMQLLPSTAQGIATNTGGTRFRTEDLWNPEINVRYGAFYLRRLLNKYGDEQAALAAYNAGQSRVDEWRAAGRGIVFAETRAYVRRVDELKRIYRDAWASELGYGESSSRRRSRAAPVSSSFRSYPPSASVSCSRARTSSPLAAVTAAAAS
jgi:soluble lytic murein transglycosylase